VFAQLDFERFLMNRIDEKFMELKKQGKTAFIPYITAGDPDMKTTEKIVYALVKAGADLIELGVPFSDPLADGPTIQKAIQRSLDNGCTTEKTFGLVKTLRKRTDVPFIFMTYYNIVFTYGVEKFIKKCKTYGVDGIIIPDIPMEESEELNAAARAEGICLIMLAAPTTPLERVKKISKYSRGFLYYVSITGVTGAGKALSSKLAIDVKKIRKAISEPVCVGFGISSPDQARDIARGSDGVIVGSAIIKRIENNLASKNKMLSEIETFSKSIAKAVHKA
jgi:tryptophan synthase alpha chain